MAVGMSIGDVLAAKQQQKKAVGIEDHSIPFYIIDPTGELIREQRRLMRSMHKQDELAKMSPDQREAYVLREKNRHPIERYLHNLEWPTLYPGWDMITAIALLFTAAVTPFEVGYLPAPKRADEPLFIINRIIDCIFIFDMLCAFFLMQRSDVTKDGGSAHEWEMRLPVLAASYIKGWFVIDVMSVAPSIFDILPVMGAGESAGAVKTMRTIRALRLIKLLRLVRTSKVVQRLAAYASMSSFTNTILSLALKFVCAVHMYACIVAIETTLVPSRLESWMATHGYCRPVEDGDGFLDADSGGVVDADGVECVSTGLLYLACLKWAMGLIAGGGLNGPALALALAQNGLSVTVIDAREAPLRADVGFDGRAYALALGSQRLLSALGLWADLGPKTQPILQIKASDGRPSQGAEHCRLADRV